MKEVKIEYYMLSGERIKKVRSFEEFPGHHDVMDFVSQENEEPKGMFFISGMDTGKEKFILTQIDCDEIHWKKNEEKRGQGPDKKCGKKCPFYEDCPISSHIIMMADIH